MSHDRMNIRRGLALGITAYFVWGFFPLYFKTVSHVPPFEMVSHRIVWSVAFLLLVLTVQRSWGNVVTAFRNRRALVTLVCSTSLISLNWLVFIYAVAQKQVLQSSLGYFITPLVSVLLGYIFLGERMRPLQKGSVFFAVAGVLYLTVSYGIFPWIALVLAASFGGYGLLRKVVSVDSLTGLTVETLLTVPVALGYLISLGGSGAFLTGSSFNNTLLPLAGVVTAVPLLLFAGAARRLPLMTIGFLQYLTPTLHFVIAVVIFGEPFTRYHVVSFLLIWSGLALYIYDALHSARLNIAQTLKPDS